jgi:hypothetical protein
MNEEATTKMLAIKDSFTLAIRNAEDIDRLRNEYKKAIGSLKT